MKRQDLLALKFYEKSAFTGSEGPLRYKIEKYSPGNPEGGTVETCLRACIWRGQFASDHTPEEDKTYKDFEFSEEGLLQITEWINSLIKE